MLSCYLDTMRLPGHCQTARNGQEWLGTVAALSHQPWCQPMSTNIESITWNTGKIGITNSLCWHERQATPVWYVRQNDGHVKGVRHTHTHTKQLQRGLWLLLQVFQLLSTASVVPRDARAAAVHGAGLFAWRRALLAAKVPKGHGMLNMVSFSELVSSCEKTDPLRQRQELKGRCWDSFSRVYTAINGLIWFIYIFDLNA